MKAWASDIAVEVSSLGVQVHGGTGYVDDCEASQLYRDARIGPVFEGTNYIQSQDLLGRKILRDQGHAFGELLAQIEQAARALDADSPLHRPLLDECAGLRLCVQQLLSAPQPPPEVGSVAYPFLQWLGVVAGGWQWAIAAHQALKSPVLQRRNRRRITRSSTHCTSCPRARCFAAVVAGGADIVARAQL